MTTLTVLGGSAAGVGTGQGCSGYLVQSGRTSVVLDLGPDTLLELRKHADMRTLDGIIVSHLHMDHILDLFALRFALAYAPTRTHRRVPLWLPPGGLAFFSRAADLFGGDEDPTSFFTKIFDLNEYDPSECLTLGILAISFEPTKHSVPCCAMRVHREDDPSGDLFYSGDTSDTAALNTFAEGARVILCESTLPETPVPESERPHPHVSAQEAARLALHAGATTLVLTHIWEEDDPHRAVHLATQFFPGEIILARPGEIVRW
jgi:ribonuclease BN (tRNA processing enzyme)